MIPALGFAEHCYRWGETHPLLTSQVRDRYEPFRVFCRCVYITATSAVIAPVGCCYHLFKAVGCEINGRRVASRRHFVSAIRDSIAFLRGAVIPITAIALIYFNQLKTTTTTNILNKTTTTNDDLGVFCLLLYYMHQDHAIAPDGLNNARMELVGDQIYWTHVVQTYIHNLLDPGGSGVHIQFIGPTWIRI